jgi:hypothetical protein
MITIRSTLFLMAIMAAAAQGGDEGLIEILEHTYGPFSLKPDTLQQLPPRMEVTFPEDLWLVGYKTEMIDVSGEKISRELQCHTFLGTSLPEHHTHEEVTGLFSDGYTPSLRLPAGFGILMKAGQKVYWTPMFNNRFRSAWTASMRLTIDVIRARNLKQPLHPLITTFRTVQIPDLYYVASGRDVRETTFALPFTGKIHAMGTHIHPYGVSIELVNITSHKTVWRAEGRRGEDGRLIGMPIYVNLPGYEVKANDKFKLIAVYENPTAKPVDAMAGVYILYAPAD